MYCMYFILEAMNYLLLINISGWLRYQNFAIKKNYGDSLRPLHLKEIGLPEERSYEAIFVIRVDSLLRNYGED